MQNDYLKLLESGQSASTDAGGNPYLDLLTQKPTLRASMYQAAGADPDQEAKARRVAGYLGWAPPVVQALPQEADKAAKIKRIEQDTASAPVLQKRYSDADWAKLAHDDSGVLSSIESAVSRAARFVMGAEPGGGLPGEAAFVARNIATGLPRLGSSLYGAAAAPFELVGLDGIGGMLRNRQKDAKAEAQRWAGMPEDAGFVRQAVGSGLQSAGQNLAVLPLGFANSARITGENLLLSIMGTSTFGDSYGKARDAGLNPARAIPYAAQDATAEIVTEKYLGMAGFLKQIKAGESAGKMFAYQVFKEVPGEMAATLWQNFNEWANVNQDKSVADFIAEQPAELASTVIATLVGGTTQIGAVKALEKVSGRAGRQQMEAAAAESRAQAVTEIATLAEASKLRERDPQAFAQFAEELTASNVPNLYVNAQTLNQAGIDMQAVAQAMPSVAAQIQQAIATGGDIVIPTAEFLTIAPKQEFAAALIDNARTAPDAMSAVEARDYMNGYGDQLQAEIQRAMTDQQMNQELQASRDAVRAEFMQELQSAGRFTPQVNEQYADMLAAFYTVQAGRLGVTPQELLQKYRVKVSAREAQGGQRLDQAAQQQTPEFRAWFGDSKVVDAQGKPLVVYHGTASNIAEFDGRSVYEGGIYFTSDPRYASGRARIAQGMGKGDAPNLVPAYIKIENPAPSGYSVERAKAEGFDGIIRDNEVVAFTPTQIKSAIGNRGTFDPNDANILNQGAEAPRAQISLPDSFASGPAVISLFKGADLSSFIHESAHLFLEIHADMAMQIKAQQAGGASVSEGEAQIAADFDMLLDWMGVKATPELSAADVWATMTLNERRDAHEKFARGFEAYAFEGKSPSVELQGMFRRFRAWLLNVYKKLSSLNVELTDEVRGVMDRMLASTEQIQEAEAAREMGPLFETAEQAGMTAQEWADYHARALDVTAQAIETLQARGLKDMQWLQNARSRELKKMQKQHDQTRREVRVEARAQIMSQPVYRAWDYLTRKKADASEDGEGSGKMWREPVKAYNPDQYAALEAQDMLRDRGAEMPDIVAERFDFTSGDEMIKALAAAKPPKEAIEELTDQMMLERYGDLATPEGLERAVDEALHSDARARFIASELAALEQASKVRQKIPGTRRTVDVLAAAAKDYAAKIVAELKVRDIRPAQYQAAEARAARAAQKALKAGDTEQAIAEKRNQVIQAAAAKAALEARTEVEKAVRYFRKFDKRSKSLDADYSDQIEALLERFDLRASVSLKDVDKRKSLVQWVESQRQQHGIDPDIPEELLNEASRKSFREMTVEEVRGLRDTIMQIEHMGRLKHKLLKARDARDLEAITMELAEQIRASAGARPVKLEGHLDKTRLFKQFLADHRKLNSLAFQMDGGKDNGIVYRTLIRSMNDAGTLEQTMLEDATVKMAELMQRVQNLPGGLTGDIRSIPEIKNSLSRGGRLAVALNWGNETNRKRVMDGDQWNETQVNAVLSTLSREELQFVNDVWALIDSYWPQIAEKQRRVTGVAPEKVEAMPFTVTMGDGSVVQMRGGYYPIKYDADRSLAAEKQAAMEDAKELLRGAAAAPTTRRGHTKARAEEVKGRPIRKDLTVIPEHITQVVHDLAWHEWFIDANKILNSDRVQSAIREHYGAEVAKSMRESVNAIAVGDVSQKTAVDRIMLKMRSATTRAIMGYSLTVALLQPFGLTQSMARIGVAPVLRGIGRWGGDAVHMENTAKWVREKSDFMRLRAKTFNREIHEISQRLNGKSKTMQVIDASMFILAQKMQAVADIPTWVGMYEKALTDGMDESTAIALADEAVLASQGGGTIKDLAMVQRNHPFITQFYSYFNTTLNLVAQKTGNTEFQNPKALAGWLADMALLVIIPAIGPSLLKHIMQGGEADDPEKLAKKLLEWQASYALGLWVGLRELPTLWSPFDYQGPPVAKILTDAKRLVVQVSQGDIDEPAIIAAINLAGTALGLPTLQLVRSYKGWKAYDEDGAPITALLMGPPQKD